MTVKTLEIKVPGLPESVADATVLTWHKKVGDSVKRDENMVDLETDKIVLEVPAPFNGILKEIKKPSGQKVVANDVLGVLEQSDVVEKSEKTTVSKTEKTVEKPVEKTNTKTLASAEILSPSVRRVVSEHEVDASNVQGSGKNGRVTKQDVLAIAGSRPEKRVPMSRLRQRIAERLLNAQQNAAILTTFNEVNLHEIIDLRTKYKEAFEKKYNTRLGFMSFFTRAVTESLKLFPAINASIDGTDVIYHGYYDIGVAVSTERGLVVPVLRDADKLSLAEIENKIAEFGKRAKENQLTMEEITGGTFTITNGGVFGSLLSTPILNPPQSAILGMHKIQERPMVENGQVVIRPMMYLALSYDHRIIDGKDSVKFLVTIKEFLEDPARLLLEI
jgi:2-oxoglutarate dehydrogenase E2 component (dihydrolipoamide succinyltransferase)